MSCRGWEDVATNGEWLTNAFSAWPARGLLQRGKGLCFSQRLGAFNRLLWLLFRFFRLPQRMEGSLTDLLRKRERIPTQKIDMIVAQRGKAFNILWYDLYP